jgi:FtsZ-binding cell division protein ZapB
LKSANDDKVASEKEVRNLRKEIDTKQRENDKLRNDLNAEMEAKRKVAKGRSETAQMSTALSNENEMLKEEVRAFSLRFYFFLIILILFSPLSPSPSQFSLPLFRRNTS